jgi:hypothetical protein
LGPQWRAGDSPAVLWGAAVTPIRIIAIAVAAASLAACSTSPMPLSVEESLYFDKATGPDITHVPPGLRMRSFDYPPPPHRIYRGPPPPLPPDEP